MCSVDSQLAKQSNLSAVSEILNGCMWVIFHPHGSKGAHFGPGVVFLWDR